MDMTLTQKICVWALPLLFAIVMHEVAHGYVALKFGDKTAQVLGRLSLNPLKHIDPIGTVIIPLVLLALGGFIFGWAKPVPINQQNLRNPRFNMVFVALAGPLSNLIMALIWAGIAKAGIAIVNNGYAYLLPLVYMGQAGIFVNIMLFILNIIPLPPLDGGRVISNLLPPRIAYTYDKIEPFGFLILLILLATGLLSKILSPAFYACVGVIIQLFGLQ